MCNSSRSLDWLMKKFGACLIVGVLGAFMSTEMVFAEKVPPVESILDEVLELVASLTKVGDEDRLVEIAIRQAKVRSCEKARDIFRTTIDSREARAVKEKADYWRFDLPIGFLHGLVEVQRRAGCVEEMKYTAQRLIALYQQRNQKHLARSAGNKLAVARYKLELELDLGSLYLSMGDVESVRSLPQGILSSVRSLPQSVLSSVRTEEWSPGFEFRSAARSAAVFLARMGHDAEALEVVSLYDMFYDARPTVAEEDDNLHHWITRVSMLAEVAEAQAEAGHGEAARATLRRAVEKARSTPEARLTEVYGEQERPVSGKPGLHSIGQGVALQSAGAMTIVGRAARIGETALALEAFELASPLVNETASTGDLIMALAKNGDQAAAQKLLDRYQCRSIAIVRGLLERQDWSGAIRAEEAMLQKSSCCERECDFFEGGTDYWVGLSKARTFVRGEASALAWARNQSKSYKVDALLGVIDALVEKNRAAVPSVVQ